MSRLLHLTALPWRSIEAARKHLRPCFAIPDAGFWTGLVQQAVSVTLRWSETSR